VAFGLSTYFKFSYGLDVVSLFFFDWLANDMGEARRLIFLLL